MFIDPDDTTMTRPRDPAPASIANLDDGRPPAPPAPDHPIVANDDGTRSRCSIAESGDIAGRPTPPEVTMPAIGGDRVAELLHTRWRERERPAGDTEPLATLARRYLERRREFDQVTGCTGAEVEAFNEAQEALLNQMEDTPAVLLDDIITKLAVITEEIWDRVAGDEKQLETADYLVATLADDFRRVLGATTAYRFDPRFWVESAIRAGVDPWVMICQELIEEGRRKGWYIEKSRRLLQRVEGVNPIYESPQLSRDEYDAVIEELKYRGRADCYSLPPPSKPEPIAAE